MTLTTSSILNYIRTESMAPLKTEFDSNRTTKTAHYRKRVHKRPSGAVGISVWELEMNRTKPSRRTSMAKFNIDDILDKIVPHELGTNPWLEGTQEHDFWEAAQGNDSWIYQRAYADSYLEQD